MSYKTSKQDFSPSHLSVFMSTLIVVWCCQILNQPEFWHHQRCFFYTLCDIASASVFQLKWRSAMTKQRATQQLQEIRGRQPTWDVSNRCWCQNIFVKCLFQRMSSDLGILSVLFSLLFFCLLIKQTHIHLDAHMCVCAGTFCLYSQRSHIGNKEVNNGSLFWRSLFFSV